MKKIPKWIWAVLVIGVLAVIFVCTQLMKPQEETYTFEAAVLEVMEDRILVDVTSGDMAQGEAEVLISEEMEFPQVATGDKIQVVFDGICTRSLPPQIPGVRELKVVK